MTGHVYTVLGAYEAGGDRLLRIRNPWGHEEYHGPWNDHDSSNWDATIQGQVQTYAEAFPDLYSLEDEGIFFIDYETYHSDFYST